MNTLYLKRFASVCRPLFFCSIFLAVSCGGCSQLLSIKKIAELDFAPPIFDGINIIDSRSLQVNFSEDFIIDDDISVDDLSIDRIEYSGLGASIFFNEDQVPGKEYILDFSVCDNFDNSSSLLTRFYGFNDNLPSLLINELRVNGSSSRPDVAELFCTKGGNLAGVVIYAGSENSNKSSYVFPNCEIDAGEFLVVHFKPEGLESEVQEVNGTDIAVGRETEDFARDFWVVGGSGLSGTNGAVSLYANKGGNILDCVIYSNRTSTSDTTYRGFGTSYMLEIIKELELLDCWAFDGDLITPEDCISPETSTSTRTICRNSDSFDSDSSSDWHIVPSSSCTIGAANCDDIYVKK